MQLSSGKCRIDILVCHIYSSSAISIPNSLSFQVNTVFFSLTASAASSACYLRIKLCAFCLLKHCQLQSFWNQTLTGNTVGEAGELSDMASTPLATGKREGEKNHKRSLNAAHISRETHREHIFTAPRCHFHTVTFLPITTFHDGAAK